MILDYQDVFLFGEYLLTTRTGSKEGFILLWSVATGLIQEKTVAIQLLENLANSSLWISDRVIQEAQAAIDGLLE